MYIRIYIYIYTVVVVKFMYSDLHDIYIGLIICICVFHIIHIYVVQEVDGRQQVVRPLERHHLLARCALCIHKVI